MLAMESKFSTTNNTLKHFQTRGRAPGAPLRFQRPQDSKATARQQGYRKAARLHQGSKATARQPGYIKAARLPQDSKATAR